VKSITIELEGKDELATYNGDVVGHKFDPRNPEVIIAYANNGTMSTTVIIPIKKLLCMEIKETK
jgi:hypothetical protein